MTVKRSNWISNLTHYPKDIETAKKITLQEVKSKSHQKQHIHVSNLAHEVLEQISFEARKKGVRRRKKWRQCKT